MSIRYTQTPLSQTSLITIPSSVAPSVPVTLLAPTSKPVTPPDPNVEEVLQSEVSKLKNDMKKLQEEEQEREETSLEDISSEEMERMSSEKH